LVQKFPAFIVPHSQAQARIVPHSVQNFPVLTAPQVHRHEFVCSRMLLSAASCAERRSAAISFLCSSGDFPANAADLSSFSISARSSGGMETSVIVSVPGAAP
jgi:hypothetical protein